MTELATIDGTRQLRRLDQMTGLSLAEWATEAEAAADIARVLAGTAFIPDSLKVYDDRHGFDLNATVAQVAAALLTGQELGFRPMASLRSIDVIPPGSGSPALRAMALRGLVLQRGHEMWIEESTDARAVVCGRRAGTEKIMESIWTIDRARKMQLRGFTDSRSAWQKQPASMLVARATAECARWIAADALLGLPYIVEEIEDGDAGPAADLDGGAAQHSPPAAARRSKTRQRKSAAPLAAIEPADSPSPAAPAGANGDAGQEEPPAVPLIDAARRAALWAGLKRVGLLERPAVLEAVSGWVGRPVKSSNELTVPEAEAALEAIKALEERRAVAAEQDQAAEEGPPDDG